MLGMVERSITRCVITRCVIFIMVEKRDAEALTDIIKSPPTINNFH
jgi:hypothetical protein